MKATNKNRGFTLVEILVVLAILGILMAIAVPGVMSMSKKMKNRGLDSKIESIEEAAVVYAQENSNRIKSEILKNNKAIKCKSNQYGTDGKQWCWCDPNSTDKKGNKVTDDCKFVFTVTVDELISEGHFKSETPKDPKACDVTDPTNSSNCLDCIPITVKLDDDYKNATAEFDKSKIGDTTSC